MPTALAPAKVNLFLHVGPVQDNGRHPLDSLVVFAGPEAADTLDVETAQDLSLIMDGPEASGLEADSDNLVLRAARALQAETGTAQGAAIRLVKRLPVAGGIGGGSADAAAALRLLTDVWGSDPDCARAVAPGLGGDVPVALHNAPALMRGEGERVLPVRGLPPIPAVLVNPRLACPTGPVFAAYDAGGGGKGFRELDSLPEFGGLAGLIEWLRRQRNDLERPVIGREPGIAAVLEDLSALDGCRLARMSGSGATCFALFDTMAAAETAARSLASRKPGWWVRPTMLGDGG